MQYLSQRLASKASPRQAAEPTQPAAGGQRGRLLDAAEQLAGDRGCAGTSIEAIVAAAHVSSATFYEYFADKESCFAAALERAVAEESAALAAAAAASPDWGEGARAALAALLAAIEARPARARLCLLEAQTGGPRLLRRYEEALDAAAAALRRGRGRPGAPAELPPSAEEVAVGGIAWLLRQRLEAGKPLDSDRLLDELAQIALFSYG